MPKKDISIVIPAYNEENNVVLLYHKLKGILDNLKKKYEIIFIDDGSTDGTFNVLQRLHKTDKKVKLIRFQRNFGKADALSAGFEASEGSYIITMDADLQDDPDEIPRFLDKLKEGYDLVVGWKYQRKDPLTKRIASKFFNAITRIITGIKIHDSNCGFKAYRKSLAKELNIYGELHRYIPSLSHWYGYKLEEIKVKHHPRRFGQSKYKFSRLIKGFIDLITVKFLMSYGKRPSHLFGPIGVLLSGAGFATIIYQYIRKFFYNTPINTRPYMFMLAILFVIIGIQFISLGLLGEMIRSISRKREYKIRNQYGTLSK